ncbi:MAG TPA: ABC transporter permease [Vicinamibacterales bacterium]|nr:ABC transporter permease [Vicinamibacterales bacterium]
MSKVAETWRRLMRLGRRSLLDRELQEEMRQHIEMQAQDNIAAGMPEREAYRAARLAFGNPAVLREQSREAWSFLRLETWLQDLAYGARLLWHDRGWALVAVATLALGIGGTVAIFTFINAFLLRPLPFHEPDRLVHVWSADTRLRILQGRLSVHDLLDLRREATLFTDLAAFNYTEEDLTGPAGPERVFAGRITANAFALLGVEPMLGRGFGPGADAPGAAREVVIGEAFWRTRFDADPDVVGRVLHLNNHPHTIIGVMPAEFVFPLPITQLWAPRVLDPSADGRSLRHLQVVGRLKPGVERSQAAAELRAIAARLAERHAESADITFLAVPLRDALNFASEILGPMSAALGASAFLVFLVVCANVANLMLARSVVRTHEMALRAALGAGRWRLIRQLLTESVLLALSGGVAGALLAAWSLSRIAGAVPPDLYRVGALAVDRDALAFTFAVTVASIALFGILPALRGTRPDPNSMLRDGHQTGSGPRHRRSHRLLVVAQIATSAVLLVAAALMMGSVRELRRVPLGFEPRGVLTAKLVLRANRYPGAAEVMAFHREVVARAAALPGVSAAAIVDYLPLNHEFPIVEAYDAGTPVAAGEGLEATELTVSAEYFSAMGIPLLRGRTFTERDDERAARVAVVSEGLAQSLAGGGVLDRTLVVRSPDGGQRSYTIVGVAADSRHRTLKDAPDRHVYVSQLQEPTRYLRVLVRTPAAPVPQAAALREAVRSVDPELPVTEVRTLAAVVQEFLAPEWNIAKALTENSITALLLALVGIYGISAFSVALRRREIGVRMALGATRAQVLRLVVGQGLRTGAVGVVVGLVGAYALTRFLSDFLFGVSAADPAVFAAVAGLLLACTALACYVPARRASRVNPVDALRAE